MKAMITVCIVAVLLSEFANAQLPIAPGIAAPIVPPVMPPIMAGLPFPFLGPLGFPFLGPLGFPFLGPLGLGLGLGLGRLGGLGLGLGLGGLGRPLLRGKRDLESTQNEVRCIISTTNNTIQCSLGVDKQIGCQFEPRLDNIPKIKVNLVNLAVFERLEGNIQFLSLISTKSHSKLAALLNKANIPLGTFTFIHPSTLEPILLGIYSDSSIGVPGFLIKDQVCFNSLASVVKTNNVKVRTNLIIA